jgi:hypothetical protein
LLLSAGQRDAPLADDRLIAGRERLDILVESRDGSGFGHPRAGRLRGVRDAEGNIVDNGIGKQERLLRNEPDRSTKRRQRDPADVDPVDEHRPWRRLVQPREEVDER